MELAYKVRGSVSGQKESVRVSFQPPLSGYDEVKPRLLGMTADAYEALGMVNFESSWQYISTISNYELL